MWDTNRDKIEEFLLKANSFHPTIKFTAEISETEMIFLDTSHGTKVTDSSKNLYLMCTHNMCIMIGCLMSCGVKYTPSRDRVCIRVCDRCF